MPGPVWEGVDDDQVPLPVWQSFSRRILHRQVISPRIHLWHSLIHLHLLVHGSQLVLERGPDLIPPHFERRGNQPRLGRPWLGQQLDLRRDLKLGKLGSLGYLGSTSGRGDRGRENEIEWRGEKEGKATGRLIFAWISILATVVALAISRRLESGSWNTRGEEGRCETVHD